MIRPDFYENPDNLPEYYRDMYLDGFEPWQILEATHRSMRRCFQAAEVQPPEDYNINIKSEVKVRK